MLDSFTEARILRQIREAVDRNGFVSEAQVMEWLIPYLQFSARRIVDHWIDTEMQGFMHGSFRSIVIDGQRVWVQGGTSFDRSEISWQRR